MKHLFYTITSCLFLLSCSNSKHIVAKNTETISPQATEAAALQAMQQSGIDFYAKGNDAAKWNLKMNYDDTVRFSSDDGLAVKFGFNQLKKDLNAERSVYSGKINNADITIVIAEKPCTVSTEKQVYKKQVTFTFNSKAYTGCGLYLADNTLNGKWLLEKTGNATIAPEDYNRIPTLQFDLEKGKLSGNDGCNSLGGNIEVQGNRIKFSKMISTKMACMKKNIEGIIGSSISDKTVDYYFKEGKLYLYLIDDSVLVFKKG